MGFFDDLKKKVASVASDFLQEDNTIPMQNIVNKPQPEQKKIFFNEQLDALLDVVLTDGEISEKERAVLCRKAESFGIDPDEFEIMLDAEIPKRLKAMSRESATDNDNKTSNKEGTVKKCPACGSTAQAFQTTCPDCGHEFRNIEATDSVKQFFEEYQNIDNMFRKKNDIAFFNALDGSDMRRLEYKKTFISNYPISNSKEDILEFLSMAVPLATIKAGHILGGVDPYVKQLKAVWFAKCQQIIMKARFSMKEDKKTLEQIEYYAKLLKIK